MTTQTALAVFSLFVPACQAAPQKAEVPPMPEPIAKFWEKLAKAKTLAVTVRSWRDTLPGPRDKPRALQMYDVGEVKIQRPNLYSIRGQLPKVEETPHPDGG